MLGWFKSNYERFGLAEATNLFVKSYGSAAYSKFANAVLPARFACPCCGWRGHRFLDYFEHGVSLKGIECPSCHSHGRHRAFYWWLQHDADVKTISGRALIFAPERALSGLWNSWPGLTVIRSDIEASRGIDVFADIQQLPFAEGSFDLIWCHHVLEQVPDDVSAMSELQRVLKPVYGRLIISSGLSGDAQTVEFGGPNPKRFDNWRSYGEDFTARLGQAGFDVKPVDYGLTAAEAHRFGIDFSERAFICTKSG